MERLKPRSAAATNGTFVVPRASRPWRHEARRLLPVLALATMGVSAMAAELHVSPTGKDDNPGTKDQPLKTVAGAQKAVRASKARAAEPVVVLFHAGTYYLPEPVVFTAEDSGGDKAPVTYAAAEGEAAIISGGARLELTWEPHKDGIMKAKVPDGLTTDQLFVNGERQHMARYPNFDPNQRMLNGYAKDCFSPERAKRWADPRGGFIHAMHNALWGDMHYVITGKDENGKVKYEGGWQNNRPSGMHGEFRYVENIFEELDAPGEWFLDGKTNTLYFFPPKDVDLAKATVEAVRLRHLLEFKGTEQQPVKWVTLRGLTFRHAARTFMENKEPLLRSDWTTYRGGAVFLTGCEDCALEDCFLDQLGGNAVFASNYNRRITVRGCHIAKAGANGVAFVGDPGAVRVPLYWNSRPAQFASVDKTPGPKTNNYPADCLVEECLIYLTGRVEKQTSPVQIAMAQSITVRHCSLYDVPRAGINIGDGCWGGHVIEFCDIFDTVKETGDHGSFNSWARDRWWGMQGVDLHTVTLGDSKELPRLDVVKPVILRNNRWRCDHGWDIDLDDGSTNYQIYNNLCLNGGLKLREGYYRLCENNIMVNNSFHPHVWYRNSQDVFRKNIVCTQYQPIGVPKPWGQECDYNLFHVTGKTPPTPAAALQNQSGLDEHSIVADALFAGPEKGDYSVAENSPAIALGFKNFPMDQFGVTRPELKKLAKMPALPAINVARPSGSRRDPEDRATEWMGAKVKNITSMGEMSAYGLPGMVGALLTDVPPGTALAKAGLAKNDVIMKFDDKPVKNVQDLQNLSKKFLASPGQQATVGYRRTQKDGDVTITNRCIRLSPGTAEMVGDGARPAFDAGKDFLGSWVNEKVSLKWTLNVGRTDSSPYKLEKPGTYDVSADIASTADCAGCEYEIVVGDKTVSGKTPNTGGWEQFTTVTVGTVEVGTAGQVAVVLKPVRKKGAAVMNLRAVMLTLKE